MFTRSCAFQGYDGYYQIIRTKHYSRTCVGTASTVDLRSLTLSSRSLEPIEIACRSSSKLLEKFSIGENGVHQSYVFACNPE